MPSKGPPSRPVVYVLTCSDGTLYTGWTTDLPARLAAHGSGTGARYTRSRLPLCLLASWEVRDRGAALRDEAAFKRLTRRAKLELLARAGAPRRGAQRRIGRPAFGARPLEKERQHA